MQLDEPLPRAGFHARKSLMDMSLAVTMKLHVSPVLTYQKSLQLAAMPSCVGKEVGSVILEMGAVRVVGVPGMATQ